MIFLLSSADCGKLFVRRSALEVHLITHSKDKPFQCDVCGKTFSQKITRNIHLARHTGKLHFQKYCSFLDICNHLFTFLLLMIYSDFTHLVHKLLLCVLYVHLSLSLCFHLHIHCSEMLWPILKTILAPPPKKKKKTEKELKEP